MRKIPFLSTILMAAAVSVFSVSVQAQDVKVDVGDVKYDDLESPQFGGNTGVKNFKPKNWLEAEVKIEAKASRRSDKKFLERLSVKWYVAVKEGKKVQLLEKDVTYVNVPVDEDRYVSILSLIHI